MLVFEEQRISGNTWFAALKLVDWKIAEYHRSEKMKLLVTVGLKMWV
jgi:hypothetical protein